MESNIEAKFVVKATMFKGTFAQRIFSTNMMANGSLALFDNEIVFEPGGRWQLCGQGLMDIVRLRYDEIVEIGVAGLFKNWLKITPEDGQIVAFAIKRSEFDGVFEFISKKVDKNQVGIIFCANCGGAVEKTSNFCGTCGCKIERG